jgi:23S rRNA pseudouridine1911/1915/1917 synthase
MRVELEPEILFENEDVVVVNKPAGLIVHYDGRNPELSIADWMTTHYPDTKEVGEPWKSPQGEIVPRPGIVHRLDRSTSGVLILVKNNDAHATIKAQFQARSVTKRYVALAYGHPKEDRGTIEAEIGRTKTPPRRWSAQFGKQGNLRAAITDWKVISRHTDLETNEPVTYLEVFPKTGRTHQIRVHLKAIHHPILCDHIYAPKKPCILGFDRPALHAASVTFRLPSGETLEVEAPLPEDFKNALDKFE